MTGLHQYGSTDERTNCGMSARSRDAMGLYKYPEQLAIVPWTCTMGGTLTKVVNRPNERACRPGPQLDLQY